MIPENDYFKHTTRTLLSEKQKRKTIEALERGFAYLSAKSKQFTPPDDGKELDPFNPRFSLNLVEALKTFQQKFKYMCRWTELIKGLTQPRHLYRRRRRYDIERLSYLIAKDTEADINEVKKEFYDRMWNYVERE